jgi:hypothetical protein
MYQKWLGNLQPESFMEIGYGSGASLRMWMEYFPQAKAYCMELAGEEFINQWKNPDTNIHNLNMIFGDSTNPETWKNVPNNLDFVVDDGSHLPEDNIATFILGFPKVKSRGIYVIEDLHCGLNKLFGGKDTFFQWAFNLILDQQIPQLASEGNFYIYRQFMNYLSRDIYSYTFYKSCCVFEKA